MPTHLTIELFPSPRRTVVAVSGEVDLATAPALAHSLAEASGSGNELLIDLENVVFMDCAGLRVVLKWASDGNGRPASSVSVTPGPPQVQKLFELARAKRLVHVIAPDPPDLRRAA